MVAHVETVHPVRMVTSITPETELERQLLADARLRAGLEWGSPRYGHPEGRVADHVATMLAAISADDPLRRDLRVLALTHDSFKAAVRPGVPWSPDNDHAMLARRFADSYISDERLLATLALHDEPYWLWRNHAVPEQGLRDLWKRLPDPDLFARFVELDAANEGKDLTFLWWFRRELAGAGRLPIRPATAAGESAQDVEHVKEFATRPEQQAAVARAASELVAEQQAKMQADGEVLISDDGLRVILRWHGHGSRRNLLERDGDVIREAFAAHPVFADVRPVEARILRTAPTDGTP
jgi:hypothetical protein